MFRHFIIAALLLASTGTAEEKVYLDYEELDCSSHDAFYIHQGNNVWEKTDTILRDEHGTFTFDVNLNRGRQNPNQAAAQQYWKCPYCYKYWPKGEPCGNKDCPSRYL